MSVRAWALPSPAAFFFKQFQDDLFRSARDRN
jgi:hypothetical protein